MQRMFHVGEIYAVKTTPALFKTPLSLRKHDRENIFYSSKCEENQKYIPLSDARLWRLQQIVLYNV